MIDDVVRELARRHDRWLGAQLARLAVGETLCVHELPDDGGLYRVTIRVQAHVLAAGEGCDDPVRRTQYGPMTAEIQAQVARVAEGGRGE
ncbi:hypothetical protein GCM10010399_63960 [Dactylosporangium fulvum]|uniref:Uncharacterized protein n=1 Tax=Dactylosporangium fulvum TaxID=53359 RepID=A0ABY5WCE3_9ACTN|nr:hypothetical protein [Dactylosporangium fulvum]UWP85781.1 hypothetical protein Dfulv_16675 [Dactylosporangium fulvum]